MVEGGVYPVVSMLAQYSLLLYNRHLSITVKPDFSEKWQNKDYLFVFVLVAMAKKRLKYENLTSPIDKKFPVFFIFTVLDTKE